MGQRTALITGATSGIGEATARLLAKNKYNLILCGRRRDRLENLQGELSKQIRVTTLSFDVRDYGAVKTALNSLAPEWKKIDVLINNAGNAHGMDPIHKGSIADWDAMMDINVKGLLYVSREVIMCTAPASSPWMPLQRACGSTSILSESKLPPFIRVWLKQSSHSCDSRGMLRKPNLFIKV
jgi:NADP-dependent 3-hydroxy acid dehydrogenase YdfG